MRPSESRGEAIRRFILRNVQANPRTISRLAGEEFGVGRQAVGRHLRRLVEEGALRQSGRTNSRVYRLAVVREWTGTYAIGGSSDEDLVWRNDIAAVLGDVPDNVRNIWHHGFTEMFNNAVEHSAGSTIIVAVTATAVTAEMQVRDDGVGIFRKIQRELGLLDERHALFELWKGKLTTDPQRHTGEGIFFTSRFDAFEILSGGVFFSHETAREEDWLLERSKSADGTAVFMRLDNDASRTAREVFDRFTADDDDVPIFSKTVVPVRLAQYGDDRLISRSQAKRVLARVDRFSTVLLDFRDVPTIGQAFADEVFRVFRRAHPDLNLVPINENAEVKRMIARAQSTRSVEAAAPNGPADTPSSPES